MIIELAKQGKTDEVMKLVRAQPDVCDSMLSDLLGIAVWEGHHSLALELLKYGADPNVQTTEGVFPLFSAIEQQDEVLVRALIEFGADLNIADGFGTPLHRAVDIEGDGASQLRITPTARITPILLSAGANPNVKNSRGETPLDIANSYGHAAARALLIEKATSSEEFQ